MIGELEFRGLISNILCMQPFIPVRITNSQGMRFAVIAIAVVTINA